MLLAGAVLAPTAFAQTSDVPPNAVGDAPRTVRPKTGRSWAGRRPIHCCRGIPA